MSLIFEFELAVFRIYVNAKEKTVCNHPVNANACLFSV